MKIATTVAFEGMPESDAVQKAAWKHAAGLEKYFGRITACRVTVVHPHDHSRHGGLYKVCVILTVPGNEIVVDQEHRFDHAHEDVYVAMRDAFRAARRQLQDHVRRMRGLVKSHIEPTSGTIAVLSPEGGHGFITTTAGRRVYFHRNAMVEGNFERLRLGDRVWFREEPGDMGPQASSVHISHPHRSTHSESEVAT
jgi:cold shock CspA family protein/ribosome-associated translation inhibitor RaiA